MHARRKEGAATAPTNVRPRDRARAKAEAIIQRTAANKRGALQEALVSKLVYKYAKRDEEFARIIGSLVAKLVQSSARLVEADISALEKTVKKLYEERGRKQRRDVERPGFQPTNGGDALDAKVAEMEPRHSGSRATTRADEVDLKKQDEWVLINALNSVEFEEEEREAVNKKQTKTVLQRQWLESQKREKEQRAMAMVVEKHEMYNEQVSDYQKWKAEEQAKTKKTKEAVEQIRKERDRQLRESKELHVLQEAKRRHEEELEVARCKEELKRTEMEALERKQQQHARMQALLKENIQVQNEKEKKKLMDQGNSSRRKLQRS
ncbi:hypothetical protein Ae201684_005449 [Aphanomyces euteiches]|uniref:Trichohyalin-plectin-homology domain-containing protein n=1 Tax=Aphanomyces euteiches TaxID=100861 RepID=A0A6G0XF55_9STRA|nr:hypothetical protein Ae201684_005449 [Aphanomyces euteiches]